VLQAFAEVAATSPPDGSDMKHTTLTLWLVVLVAPIGCASFPKPSMPSFSRMSSETTDRMLSMARLMERHGKYEEALRIYEKILERQPKQAIASHRLGVLAVRRGEHAMALEYFERARGKEKASADLLNDIGYTQYLTNDLESAEATLREALQANPHLESARTNLGLVLAEQGREQDALVEFRKSVSEAEAHANLAYVQTRLGKLTEAEKNYHRALELNPKQKAAAEALVQYQMARDKAGAFIAEMDRQHASGQEEAPAVVANETEPRAEEAVIETVAAVVPAPKVVTPAPKKIVAAKTPAAAPAAEPTFVPPRYRHPLEEQPATEHQTVHSVFESPASESEAGEEEGFDWAEPNVVVPAAAAQRPTTETVPLIEDVLAKPMPTSSQPTPTSSQMWSSGSTGVVRLKR
jgi:Tfp pilus assembly protein PilF